MKPRLRDYLTILFALLVIFACGLGVGYLVGEKEGRSQETGTGKTDNQDSVDWTERTMARLTSSLDLDEDQRLLIRKVVTNTAGKIKARRDQAIQEYYRHLLSLHDEILPHLSPDQQETIKKDRDKLKQLLEQRTKDSSKTSQGDSN